MNESSSNPNYPMISSATELGGLDSRNIIREPLMASPDTAAIEAIALMSDAQRDLGARASCVLVVEADRLIGILTERDVVHLSAQQQPLDRLALRQVMTQPTITLRESAFTSLSSALHLLQRHRIRHLPILDEKDCPVGLVTYETLLQVPNEKLFNRDFILEESRADRSAIEQEQALKLQAHEQDLIRATQLKHEFLANMSHELRTPLNALLGMVEGLQEGVFGEIAPEQRKALQTIDRSGAHLLDLINDILDLAKVESGQIELERKPTAVTPLCQSSMAFIQQQAFKKRIQLEIKRPPYLPDLDVDERYIRQVLVNLLKNAVKFTPEEGCITLEVGLEPLANESNRDPTTLADSTAPSNLRIAVVDTGIGIAPEDLSKLFKPFVQIDSALNRKYDGTGLGLALVKSIVELHDGQIAIASEVGVGSCFSIHLPCVTTPGESYLSALECSRNGNSDFKPRPMDRKRAPLILLAEDSEANISTMSSYLRAKGYRLLVAKDGLDAIDQAQSEHPDLILMDVQMPGMNGLEAMHKIRQDPHLAKVPIIALTGLVMTGDRDRCLAAGANDYLSKPVKLKQLTATIQHLLASQAENS